MENYKEFTLIPVQEFVFVRNKNGLLMVVTKTIEDAREWIDHYISVLTDSNK